MKRINYKNLMCLLFILSCIYIIDAQDVSSPMFVKTNFDLIGFKPSQMSDNGRFIVCNDTDKYYGNTAKLWDTQTDIVTSLGTNCRANDVSNNGSVIVGLFENPNVTFNNHPVITAGYYKDGKWNAVELDPTYGASDIQSTEAGGIWSVSPDGKYFGGYTHCSSTCYRPTIWDADGKIIRILGPTEGDSDQKYSGAARAISADGSKIAGYATLVGDNYFLGLWIASFWSSLDADPIPVLSGGIGYFGAMNNSGAIAVGKQGSHGVIAKDDGTVLKIGQFWTDISETGLIVGYDVYSDALSLFSGDAYFRELYGMTIDNFSYIKAVSDNGEYMCIITNDGGRFGTALVRVSGDVLPMPPTNITLMCEESNSTSIYWELPKPNGYNPIGYNVYRGDTKLNDELVKQLTFKDLLPTVGKNCYTVSAVYQYREDSEILESPKSDSKCVEVIGESGCLSPKHLTADVTYNRTVSLNWQRPLPNYNKNNSKEGSESNNTLIPIKPNILKSFNISYAMSVASDGKDIYTMSNGKITQYTFDGVPVQNFKLGGPLSFSGLAYDGGKFYSTMGVNLVEIEEMKAGGMGQFTNLNLGQLTRLSYLSFLNDNNGGFETGANYNTSGTSYYINKEGVKIENGGIANPECITGVTYYNGIIYVCKAEDNGNKYIYLYDANTNEPTGEYIDMRSYSNLKVTDDTKLWNVSIMKSSEGIPCLTVLLGVNGTSKLVFLEIGEIEGLLGYFVYKNNTKINEEPIKTTYFSEKIFDAGKYEYKIVAAYENGCISSFSDPINIEITHIGTVNQPKKLEVEVIRNDAIISWESPDISVNPKLVGYNLFRNDVQLNSVEEYITDRFYVDKDLPLGDYKYSVNAFFNNSGESARVDKSVSLKGFNPTLPPSNLKIDIEDGNGVSLSWEAPILGSYELMSWNVGNIESKAGIVGGGTIYVASKWDKDDLSRVFDYTLTDIEFYPTQNIAHTFYVYCDNDLVLTQELLAVSPDQYNLLKLDNPISIQKGKSLMIAYKVTHESGKYPVGTDKRDNIIGKGDLVSEDGITWYSSSIDKLKGNWAISIRLMPYSTQPAKKIENITMENNGDKNINLTSQNVMRSTSKSIFKNKEVIGYNIYRNNAKINNDIVDKELFKDEHVDLSIDNCYSIETLFTGDRLSPKCDEICTCGDCLPPTITGELEDVYPKLTLSVPKSMFNNTELKFYNEEGANAMRLQATGGYYSLIKYTPAELQQFDGYYIKSIKAFVEGECELSFFVKFGNEVMLDKAIPKAKIAFGEMNDFIINEELLVDKNRSLLIGFKINAEPGSSTIGLDAGPGVSFKGDILSDDGTRLFAIKEISNGSLDANWNISVQLEKQTPLKDKFIGYNIYRNGLKINDATVTESIYKDEAVEENNTYVYNATAIWNTNCESMLSEKVEIKTPAGIDDLENVNIKVYPNPAKDILNIDGEFETLKLYNSLGQESKIYKCQNGKLAIDISTFSSGVYIIEVTYNTGETRRCKFIIKN